MQIKEKAIDFKGAKVIIGLDSIQDPANAGTVFRCAAAFGIDTIALTGLSVNLNNTKFLRAAQSSFFDIRQQRFEDVETFIKAAKKANRRLNIYLTSSRQFPITLTPSQIKFPCLILFGNEGKGLAELLFKTYPSIKIPQVEKVESLNVGVSACIMMYEITKGR